MGSNPIVQYIVLRGDLMSTLKWPIGALVAQACHACSAVVHSFHDDSVIQEYLGDLDNMHKVVLEASTNIFILLTVIHEVMYFNRLNYFFSKFATCIYMQENYL